MATTFDESLAEGQEFFRLLDRGLGGLDPHYISLARDLAPYFLQLLAERTGYCGPKKNRIVGGSPDLQPRPLIPSAEPIREPRLLTLSTLVAQSLGANAIWMCAEHILVEQIEHEGMTNDREMHRVSI